MALGGALHHLHHAGAWAENQKHEVLFHGQPSQSVFVSKDEACQSLDNGSKVLGIVLLFDAAFVLALSLSFCRSWIPSLALGRWWSRQICLHGRLEGQNAPEPASCPRPLCPQWTRRRQSANRTLSGGGERVK